MMRLSMALTAALVLPHAIERPRAWSSEADAVDAYVESQRQAQRIPGIALLVIKDGRTVKAHGYGLANVEHRVPVKNETVFQSGSIGKQFTATAIMILVEEGRLTLDDPVSKYLSDMPETWNRITIRHLLSHTAGVQEYPDNFDFRRDYTEDQLLRLIGSSPLEFEPGEKWAYSNPGYTTLGILIHKITGQFYGDFLQERVFKPLGMTSTRVISEADIIPNRAAGYRLIRGQLKNQEWVSPSLNTTAEGSLYFNIVDLAKWDAALNSERLLKRSSLERMWTPARLNNHLPNSGRYGLGWIGNHVQGRVVVEHDGGWQGFSAHFSRYLDDGLTIVVLANLASADATQIVRHVAGLYITRLMPDENAKQNAQDDF